MLKYDLFHLVRGLLLLLFVVSPGIQAEIPPETGWHEPSSVRLEMDFPGDGYHASWKIHRCDCQDLLIESEFSLPGEVYRNEMLLVGGTALLSRGFEADGPDPVQAIDAPALMMQLALRLLQRAVPGGPASVNEMVEVDLVDDIHPINLDTGQAAGGFQAPWSLRGNVQPVTATLRRFDLHFSFSTLAPGEDEPQEGEIRISGHAEFAAKEFPLAGDMPLDDWDLGWRIQPEEANDIEKPETLGSLRELVEEL